MSRLRRIPTQTSTCCSRFAAASSGAEIYHFPGHLIQLFNRRVVSPESHHRDKGPFVFRLVIHPRASTAPIDHVIAITSQRKRELDRGLILTPGTDDAKSD